MFSINTSAKKEALNYATLLNVLQSSEGKLEPLFDSFAERIPVDVLMDEGDLYNAYASFFACDRIVLAEEFRKAKQAFITLKENDDIIKRGAEDYPPLLLRTQQAPRFLYVRGNKSLLFEKRTVALVGSRGASEKGKENARKLAKELGENGITVISGLAKGIDVEAHREALRCGFNTIAVIGTNLNQYYPPENIEVQLEIEKRGLVVSQFSPASETQRWFFPHRNGVMSGLSLATVIIEAGETSGALKQADYAIKQNRQVIIPKRAMDISTITWPSRYVKKGAKLAETPEDILRILADNLIFKKEKNNDGQQSIFDYLMKDQCTFSPINGTDWVEPVVE